MGTAEEREKVQLLTESQTSQSYLFWKKKGEANVCWFCWCRVLTPYFYFLFPQSPSPAPSQHLKKFFIHLA